MGAAETCARHLISQSAYDCKMDLSPRWQEASPLATVRHKEHGLRCSQKSFLLRHIPRLIKKQQS